MRLGGPVFNATDADSWAQRHRDSGYTAAYFPSNLPLDVERRYLAAAGKADLVIAEVGAWSNPISRNDTERKKAIETCCVNLALADRVGARCCVNIAGARGERWDGPDPANLTLETFDLVVESVRHIIDSVKPSRTFYALETMPWVFPDSPETYLSLIKAIDRPHFAVHLDPVNMINSPRRAYETGSFIRECFHLLGRWIKSCHAKDIVFTQHLTVHLDECRPGTGLLDYGVYLRELSKLDLDTTILLEHLPTKQEYDLAAAHLRKIADENGLKFA